MFDIFVTGNDTGVGKTFITAGLAATMQSLGYSTCVYKPVQTGSVEKNGFFQSPDLAFVKNVDPYIKTASTYLLKQNTTPSIAAENENIIIDRATIKRDYQILSKENDCIITEGTGGIITPLAPGMFVSDMIKALDIPAVIVIKPGLTTINQALLTINHAEEKEIKIRGVIINNLSEKTVNSDFKNLPRLIEEYSNAKILGIVKSFDDTKRIDPNNLITDILNGIDIESVFDVKIAKLDIE